MEIRLVYFYFSFWKQKHTRLYYEYKLELISIIII